jgi:hypothetical protein
VPHLVFGPALQGSGLGQGQSGRACPNDFAVGVTLRALLDDYLARNAVVRSCLLDDAGRLREDLVVLIDGRQLVDREFLSDPVAAASEVYVMHVAEEDS